MLMRSYAINFKKKPIQWATAFRCRREEVVLARLRVNSTRLTHLEPYINKNFPPECVPCHRHMSINHLLIDCGEYEEERGPLLTALRDRGLAFNAHNLLQDDEEIITKVLQFLKDTNLYDKI